VRGSKWRRKELLSKLRYEMQPYPAPETLLLEGKK